MITPENSVIIPKYLVDRAVEDVKAIVPREREPVIGEFDAKVHDYASYNWGRNIGKGLVDFTGVAHSVSQEGVDSIIASQVRVFPTVGQFTVTAFHLFANTGNFCVSREHSMNLGALDPDTVTDQDIKNEALNIISGYQKPRPNDWDELTRLITTAKRHHDAELNKPYIVKKIQKASHRLVAFLVGNT